MTDAEVPEWLDDYERAAFKNSFNAQARAFLRSLAISRKRLRECESYVQSCAEPHVAKNKVHPKTRALLEYLKTVPGPKAA